MVSWAFYFECQLSRRRKFISRVKALQKDIRKQQLAAKRAVKSETKRLQKELSKGNKIESTPYACGFIRHHEQGEGPKIIEELEQEYSEITSDEEHMRIYLHNLFREDKR